MGMHASTAICAFAQTDQLPLAAHLPTASKAVHAGDARLLTPCLCWSSVTKLMMSELGLCLNDTQVSVVDDPTRDGLRWSPTKGRALRWRPHAGAVCSSTSPGVGLRASATASCMCYQSQVMHKVLTRSAVRTCTPARLASLTRCILSPLDLRSLQEGNVVEPHGFRPA